MAVKVKHRNGIPNYMETAKIHYRAPVAKSYTIRMAHARYTDGVDSGKRMPATGVVVIPGTTKAYGRMWASDGDTAFTFNGEHMYVSGLDSDGNTSTIGVKGQTFPVEFKYYNCDEPEKPTLFFSGLATLDPKFGNVSGYTGVVYGTNIDPARCTLAAHNSGSTRCLAEQGAIESWATGLKTVAGVYYPEEYATPQPDAHFFGTFTMRYNAKDVVTLAKGADGQWDAIIDRAGAPGKSNAAGKGAGEVSKLMPEAKKKLEYITP